MEEEDKIYMSAFEKQQKEKTKNTLRHCETNKEKQKIHLPTLELAMSNRQPSSTCSIFSNEGSDCTDHNPSSACTTTRRA